MDNKIWREIGLKKYFMACAVFLVFMIFSICYFFYCVQINVVASAEEAIVKHVKRQKIHFNEIIALQYRYLEGTAAYMGRSGDLLSEENRELMLNLSRAGCFKMMAVIDEDGISTYEDGLQKDVSSRRYFQEAIKGKRSLSDPLISKVDGARRVILAVPVSGLDGPEGVLAGSCDVGSLSHLLFEDLYGGTGYSMVVTSSGTVVSWDRADEAETPGQEENFFDYCGQMDFPGKYSLKQMQEDFAAQTGGCVMLRSGRDADYLVYEPLDLGGWMLCYLVPAAKVREDYGFIRYYEVIFSMVLLGGLAVLLMYIWGIRSREQKELIQYAHTDALTGAVNKDSTEAEINSWLSRHRTGIQAFLMLDVDNFKTVNDRYGHGAGDEALRQIGRVLAGEFRDGDIVGRIGGDEFVVLMKDIADEENAVYRVENLCRVIRKITVKGIPGTPLSCSVGVAYSPNHGSTYGELYLCADKALYETKKRGRDGYTVYTDNMQIRGETL